MTRIWASVALVIAASWWGGQDPVAQEPRPERPPAAPAGAAPLPPVEVAWVEPVPRSDLPGRFGARDPIEGFWRLQGRSIGGRPADPGTGFLAVGRRHLMVQVQAPGADPEVPLLRAATYSWRRVDDRDHVRLLVQVGHFNETDGDVTVEIAGTSEVRRFVLLDGRLRVERGDGDWLEFARLE